MGDQLFFGVDYAGYESRSRLQRAQIQAGLPLGYGIKIDTTNVSSSPSVLNFLFCLTE